AGLPDNGRLCARLVIGAPRPPDGFTRAFSPARLAVREKGRRFPRHHRDPVIPLLLRDLLVAVAGLTNEPKFAHRHHSITNNSPLVAPAPVLPKSGAVATGVPGNFTVGDTANLYNIN